MSSFMMAAIVVSAVVLGGLAWVGWQLREELKAKPPPFDFLEDLRVILQEWKKHAEREQARRAPKV